MSQGFLSEDEVRAVLEVQTFFGEALGCEEDGRFVTAYSTIMEKVLPALLRCPDMLDDVTLVHVSARVYYHLLICCGGIAEGQAIDSREMSGPLFADFLSGGKKAILKQGWKYGCKARTLALMEDDPDLLQEIKEDTSYMMLELARLDARGY